MNQRPQELQLASDSGTLLTKLDPAPLTYTLASKRLALGPQTTLAIGRNRLTYGAFAPPRGPTSSSFVAPVALTVREKAPICCQNLHGPLRRPSTTG